MADFMRLLKAHQEYAARLGTVSSKPAADAVSDAAAQSAAQEPQTSSGQQLSHPTAGSGIAASNVPLTLAGDAMLDGIQLDKAHLAESAAFRQAHSPHSSGALQQQPVHAPNIPAASQGMSAPAAHPVRASSPTGRLADAAGKQGPATISVAGATVADVPDASAKVSRGPMAAANQTTGHSSDANAAEAGPLEAGAISRRLSGADSAALYLSRTTPPPLPLPPLQAKRRQASPSLIAVIDSITARETPRGTVHPQLASLIGDSGATQDGNQANAALDETQAAALRSTLPVPASAASADTRAAVASSSAGMHAPWDAGADGSGTDVDGAAEHGLYDAAVLLEDRNLVRAPAGSMVSNPAFHPQLDTIPTQAGAPNQSAAQGECTTAASLR